MTSPRINPNNGSSSARSPTISTSTPSRSRGGGGASGSGSNNNQDQNTNTPIPTITFANTASPRDVIRSHRQGTGGSSSGGGGGGDDNERHGLHGHGHSRRERDDETRERQERQRAQDIDSALSMSRARSNSMAILGSSIPSPSDLLGGPPSLARGRSSYSTNPNNNTPGLEEPSFPMLSESEEAEMDHARNIVFGGGGSGSGGEDNGNGRDDEDRYDDDDEDDEARGYNTGGFGGGEGRRRGSGGGDLSDEDRLGNMSRDFGEHRLRHQSSRDHGFSHSQVHSDDDMGMLSGSGGRRSSGGPGGIDDLVQGGPGSSGQPGGGGSSSLPRERFSPHLNPKQMMMMQSMGMGGMGPMRNKFDFGPMEEFAVRERRELGLDQPGRKWSAAGGSATTTLKGSSPRYGGGAGNGDLQDTSAGGGDLGDSTLKGDGDGSAQEHDELLVDVSGGDERQEKMSAGEGIGSIGSGGEGTVTHREGARPESALDDYPYSESVLATSPSTGGVGSEHFVRRRQRKLSHSNPIPGRRGQGKLALFEGFGGTVTDLPPREDHSFSRTTTMEPPERTGHRGHLHATDSSTMAGPGGMATKASRFPKNPIGGASATAGYLDYPEGGGGTGRVGLGAVGRERPYRFSFYSNALPATIHARSLGELPSENQSFDDLFSGRGGLNGNSPAGDGASDAASFAASRVGSGTVTPVGNGNGNSGNFGLPTNGNGTVPNPKQSLLAKAAGAGITSPDGGDSPGARKPDPTDPEATTWWLDVLSPTDEEMRMFSKVFGIHPLTTEDILLEETREKIELFRNYYLVCFRSFDQDPYSQTYLEPLNMYIIVFREGTLSFHFRGTSHPQNVRRRIKSLKDYISVTSDWISYALIDDITDAFGPLIQGIEYEVDGIDELVLILKEAEQSDMLRRIGTCRKKVMGLLRLMGNKADVVKGLAKRCNENWSVAPKSDIGLYLSDIQDHLITMTQNLNHYEKILSRSHSNYLAQISIEMTDANNQINDVLSKLTALGTVLIPMNLVTGLWGMNVHVPGQDIEEGYVWFGCILGGLALFAVVGAWVTIRIFVRT